MGNAKPLAVVAAATCLAGCELLQDPPGARASYESGVRRYEGRLDDGLQNGLWTHNWPNGNPRARGEYVDDVQTGAWEFWYESGTPEMLGHYHDERRHGTWTYYYRSGSVRAAGPFDHGREQGTWTYWGTRGNREQSGQFHEGRQFLRWSYWDDEGRPEAEGYFYDGRKVGPWRIHGSDGTVTVKFFEMPEGVELVRETWPETDRPRREGFLADGERTGLWSTWNRDGTLRLSGSFEDGVPEGVWTARRGTGELLAAGEMAKGEMSGEWIVGSYGGDREWRHHALRPPEPVLGEWSEASLVDRDQPETVTRTWIDEMCSPVDAEAAIATPDDWEEGRSAPLAVATELLGGGMDARPEAPVVALPLTVREEREFATYVDMYGHEPSAAGDRLRTRYGGGGGGGYGGGLGGDEEKARELLGHELPVKRFLDTDGNRVDLEEQLGKKTVFIVLRGFNGGVCVYCMAQTRAYCKQGAFEAFEDLGVDVFVLFPGTKGKVDEFARAYAKAVGRMDIPYTILREDPEMELPRELGILANEVSAFPTTLVIDEEGIVRFAYVGNDKGDRPSAERILEVLEEMDASP